MVGRRDKGRCCETRRKYYRLRDEEKSCSASGQSNMLPPTTMTYVIGNKMCCGFAHFPLNFFWRNILLLGLKLSFPGASMHWV
jgi:hypothetical protein